MKWINPEIKRPKDGQKIITESSVGLFWGIFTSMSNGVVYVEDNKNDEIWWQNIYQWIPYPKEF